MNENLSLPEDLHFSLIEGKTKGGGPVPDSNASFGGC